MHNKLNVIIICALCALISCSCAMMKFESPEEQRRREQEASSKAAEERPRPLDFLAEPLVFARKLENQAGKLLAEYTAKMPYFSEEGKHSVIFQRINEHFKKELDSCAGDCEGFFETVKRQFGEEWDVLENVERPYRVTFSYELLATPENYICVMKTYVYDAPEGAGFTRRYPDVFLAENGWRLEFDDLFGSHAADAHALLMDEIHEWSETSGVLHEKLADLPVEAFIEYYAMDEQCLIFFVEPFMLSTNDKNSYEIRLDLTLFAHLFVDSQLG